MADLVHKVIGIDQQIGHLAAGIETIRSRAARHGWSIRGIAERLFAFFAIAEPAIRASEEYSLLPPEYRWY